MPPNMDPMEREHTMNLLESSEVDVNNHFLQAKVSSYLTKYYLLLCLIDISLKSHKSAYYISDTVLIQPSLKILYNQLIGYK